MSKLLIFTVIILVSAGICSAQTGWISGTALYVGEKTGEAVEAPNITITLKLKGKNVLLMTDSLGDYYNTPLSPGKYCLFSAKSTEGKIITFSPKQIKYFYIKSNENLRFDVMLVRGR